MQFISTRIFFILIIFLSVAFSGCEPHEGEEGIPSYIHISSLSLSATPEQGSSSHKITDAWVFFGNELIGAFELPVTFPVLKAGTHQVTVYAGIKINGIAATRAPYPFFTPIITTINLVRDSIVTLTDTVVTYNDNTVFTWMENFDDVSITLDTTSLSQVALERVSDPNKIFNFPYEPNIYSGHVFFEGEAGFFECVTIESFNLPTDERAVFLELNFKNNTPVVVGIIANRGNESFQHSVLILNPSEAWNKIYVNLTPSVNRFIADYTFNVFIGLSRTDTEPPALVYLDNLKLVHF